MSRTYGKLPHRAVAALGSACFLGTLALSAAPADAGLYLALKPTSVSVSGGGTASFTVGGNVFQGFTLSLSAGAAASTYTVNYDIVAVITDGATTNPAPNSGLFNIRGAIRGTGTAKGQALIVNGASLTPGGVVVPGALPIDPDIVTANERRGGLVSTGEEGDGTLLAGQTIGLIKGVGPQAGAFGVSDSTNTSITDRSRFDLQYTTTTDDGLGLNIGRPLAVNTETVVGQARIRLEGSEGQTASIQLVGPDNGAAATKDNALGLFYENFNPNARSDSNDDPNIPGDDAFLKFLGTADATNKALAISFGPIGGTRIPGDANLNGFVDITDFGILANNFGQSFPGDAFTFGDFNASGTVDITDFGILANNFGQGTPPSPAALAAAESIDIGSFAFAFTGGVIPEPSALGLLAPAALALARRRRR